MPEIKIKVVHIHTDYKFVYNTSSFFEGSYYDNQIVIIQNNEPYYGKFKDKAILFTTKKRDIKKLINICKNSDLVVLYDLNPIKVRIVLSLPKEIKIAWRFFGYELYQRRKDIFVSEKSIQFNTKPRKIYKQQILSLVKQIYRLARFSLQPKSLFFKAIARINYMLVLSTEEYKLLNIYWPDLPEFIQLPHRYFDESLTPPSLGIKMKHEKPVIVIGNSRSWYNNHIDLIEMIDRMPYKQNYQFIFLFNYGPEGYYARVVRERVKGKPYYKLIDEFIPPEEFEVFYQKISALVINGYRQMAGANIFMAMEKGVKVYLNDKNVFMQWLKNEGLTVFSINDFEKDLQGGNIQFDMETARKSIEQLKAFSKRYTKEDFQNELYHKLTNSMK